eukprot:scaffold25172_cov33-Tisochrysis_lutea.AAC.1
MDGGRAGGGSGCATFPCDGVAKTRPTRAHVGRDIQRGWPCTNRTASAFLPSGCFKTSRRKLGGACRCTSFACDAEDPPSRREWQQKSAGPTCLRQASAPVVGEQPQWQLVECAPYARASPLSKRD